MIGVVISVVTLAFAGFFLSGRKVQLKEHAGTQLSVGLLSGVLGGSIAESGPPVVVYGLAREWNKAIFRTTLLTYFTALSVAACFGYLLAGMLSTKSLLFSGAAVVPMVAAGWVGTALKNCVGEKHFEL